MVSEGERPYAHSLAARMLGDALKRYTATHAGGLRALAEKLEMKQAVNLSHMANGRMPIPLDRATELSAILELDVVEFCLAVVEQRAPSVHAALEVELKRNMYAALSEQAHQAIGAIAGAEDVTDEQANIISEVVCDSHPSERWLDFAEVPLVKLIRDRCPSGLTSSQTSSLLGAISDVLDGSH